MPIQINNGCVDNSIVNDLVQGEYLSGFDAKKLKEKSEDQDKKKS